MPSDALAGLARVVLHVQHLGYEHTPVGLARLLGTWRGIRRVTVLADAGLVTLEFDPELWSADGLRRAIATCGYACRDACDHSCHARTGMWCERPEAITQSV